MSIRVNLKTWSNYPDAVSNNAKRGIELNEKVGNKCATQVGKVRAQQLAKGSRCPSIPYSGCIHIYLVRKSIMTSQTPKHAELFRIFYGVDWPGSGGPGRL